MQKGEREKIFKQFYLSHNHKGLTLTKTSTFAKVEAYTRGVMLREKLNLYKGQKQVVKDLQVILDFDPESASVVFQSYNGKIRFRHRDNLQIKGSNSQVLPQCRRCGKFTAPWKYCGRCEDTHYCSETCEVNVKLTHEKEECRVKMYPKIHHGTMVEVHFGSRLGHNIEIYCQHETRALGLIRGKEILSKIYQHFVQIKNTSGMIDEDQIRTSKYNAFEEKLRGYNVSLHLQQKNIQFAFKNEKDYPTGVLKVDVQNMEDIKRIYEQNPLLQQIQLYLIGEGALMVDCAEEVHNNHVHYVYIMRMP